jgi:hypothetical protein
MNSGMVRWDREVRHHDFGHSGNASDRHDVAVEIEAKLFVQRRVDRVCSKDQQKRVTIRRSAHDGLGGDIAAPSWTVLGNEWLAKAFRQPLAHQTCDDVVSASCGCTDDQTHRPRGIGLRPRNPRHHHWQRGSACGQMQELATAE